MRLFGGQGLSEFLASDGPVGTLAGSGTCGEFYPARAILFDKTPTTNWSLGWHQDRVIAVRERIDVPGFGPWTRKHGALHVGPPFEVLAAMRTIRIHLDAVAETNAPLLIAPGSHALGRIAEPDVPRVVERCAVASCLAEAGEVWIYATPILHASERAACPSRRRVLQVDYAASALTGGLQWLGVA